MIISPIISEDDLNALSALVHRLADTAPRKARRKTKSPGLSVLANGPARDTIEEMRWQLRAHVDITAEAFGLWTQHGELVPPHYPERISDILQRGQQRLWRRAFLAAFTYHFDERHADTYKTLIEQAKAVGAYGLAPR